MGQEDESAIAAGPAPEPVVTAASGGASRARQLRLAALLVLLVVIAVAVVRVVAATGAPTWDELRERAGLANRDRLIIGVKDDQPGVALLLQDGTFRGFDIDIAHMIADDLGFADRVTFLPIESEDRARRQARASDGSFVTVDLVIASYSITKDREQQGVVFSAPYLETEQSVVTLASNPLRVTSLRDLAGRKACTLATSTSEQRLREVGIVASSRNRISECVQGLYDGDVDAVTTDAAILAGFLTPRPADDPPPAMRLDTRGKSLRHWDVGAEVAERWGINTGPDPALRDLVNYSLHRSAEGRNDGKWQAAFSRNLGREQKASDPQQVAVGQQPELKPDEKVKVRQWPWERRALPAANQPRYGVRSAAARGRNRRSSGC